MEALSVMPSAATKELRATECKARFLRCRLTSKATAAPRTKRPAPAPPPTAAVVIAGASSLGWIALVPGGNEGLLVVGLPVTACGLAVVGRSVVGEVGAFVEGAFEFVGPGVTVGLPVVGATLVGLPVVGATLVGLAVVGLVDVGLLVVGLAVVGVRVVGSAVEGGPEGAEVEESNGMAGGTTSLTGDKSQNNE